MNWIKEYEGKLYAYAIKWNPGKKVRLPVTWHKAYPESQFGVITPNNYLDWIQ